LSNALGLPGQHRVVRMAVSLDASIQLMPRRAFGERGRDSGAFAASRFDSASRTCSAMRSVGSLYIRSIWRRLTHPTISMMYLSIDYSLHASALGTGSSWGLPGP
jgi:hypothetical protein